MVVAVGFVEVVVVVVVGGGAVVRWRVGLLREDYFLSPEKKEFCQL